MAAEEPEAETTAVAHGGFPPKHGRVFAAGALAGATLSVPVTALLAHSVETETIKFILSNGLPAGALLALVVVAAFAREKDKRAQKVAEECSVRERFVLAANAIKIENLYREFIDQKSALFREQLNVIPPNTRVMERIERVLDGADPL